MLGFLFARCETFSDGQVAYLVDVRVVPASGDTPPPSRTPSPVANEHPSESSERSEPMGSGEGGAVVVVGALVLIAVSNSCSDV